MVAGEPVDVLVKALRQLKWKKTNAGMMRFSAMLDRELGMPLHRALIRIERELLDQDIDQAGESGVQMRTPEQRGADALMALVLRVAEAQTGA